MGLFKKKISASEMGNVLYNFTVMEQTHKTAMKHFSTIEGLDLARVRVELMFLTIFIAGNVLGFGRRVREKYGNKADEVFDEYLRCFKQQTDQDNTGDEFGASLYDRLTVYGNIGPSTDRHWPSKLAEAFGRYCGLEKHIGFEIVAMQEFDLIFGTIIDFIDNYRVIESETVQSATSENEQQPQLPRHEPLSRSENANIVTDCPKCLQRLRIPGGRHLLVTCPKCAQVFEV
jgi:hypothetical protein